MSRVHVEYEMLCAFAAVGQLSTAELNDLTEHAAFCSSCQQRLAEMETASCTYFLHHAGNAKAAGTPLGMQQRFEERAGSMGIPLRERTAALPEIRFISLALSIVLLTFTARVGWKAFSLQSFKRTAVPLETSAIPQLQVVPQAPGSLIGDPPSHRGSSGGLSKGRNTTRVYTAYSRTVPRREVSETPSYLPPVQLPGTEAFAGDRSSPPGAFRESLGLELPAPARRTFGLTTDSRLSTDTGYSLSAKRSFRFSPTLASLSLLGVPGRVEVPRLPAMTEPPPLFRINNTKAW